MAFRVPVFNLLMNVWTGPVNPPYPPAGLPRLTNVPCQLYYVKENPMYPQVSPRISMLIRCEKLTDIRSDLSTTTADVIEVPVGSGNWYEIDDVQDVAKGFANEYRVGILFMMQAATPQA